MSTDWVSFNMPNYVSFTVRLVTTMFNSIIWPFKVVWNTFNETNPTFKTASEQLWEKCFYSLELIICCSLLPLCPPFCFLLFDEPVRLCCAFVRPSTLSCITGLGSVSPTALLLRVTHFFSIDSLTTDTFINTADKNTHAVSLTSTRTWKRSLCETQLVPAGGKPTETKFAALSHTAL